MTTQTITPTTDEAPATSRTRAGILFVTLAATSLLALIITPLWPQSDNAFYTYADIAPVRDRWYLVVTVMTVGFVLGVPAQALAAMSLARRRGSGWATTGGVMMVLGAALQATGIGGWALLYYFATGPGLDPATGTSFLDRVADDPRLFIVAMPGALLVAFGTVVQAVGLWRSRALPRWVPIVSLAILPTFFMENAGAVGLLSQVPIGIAATALGWYAWRRA